MAAGGVVEGLCDESSCPICLEYFKDPVILDCGHNFCQACLTRHWAKAGRVASCPQCRKPFEQRNFRPNRQLANVVELVKKLELGKGAKRKRGECEQHQEPLERFCEDDQAAICALCERSEEHQDHKVIRAEEAARQYKEKIQAQLQSVEKEKQNLMDQKLTEDQRSKQGLTQVELEKKMIGSAVEQTQKFLEEKKHFWLAQLDDLEKEMQTRQEENVTRFSEESSRLSNLITEMEEKCQQPASEFLQEIGDTLSRYQNEQVRQQLAVSPGLEETLRSYSQKRSVLKKAMEELEVSLERARNKVNVTLDPDTAHPELILSEDLKNVRRGCRKPELLDNPERFDRMPCVLGRERFTSGRHSWEVEVEEEKGALWAMGVARETLRRKGDTNLNPREGIWALGKDSLPCQLWAFTYPEWTALNWRYQPKKIRVSLDYEEGQVDFFDADANKLIFSFQTASFFGESIRPFFWLWSEVELKC
ncbi:zinc finger protein RFP-like [Hemicordylus capensis]|uniref:zinc finger protein RFP-like n=1 Tax=Hemicordylus capensis TaxID=884348 RepID=UPI0023040BE9|nr:zinc finger protein RFP-like [Hemicordylus capensis]